MICLIGCKFFFQTDVVKHLVPESRRMRVQAFCGIAFLFVCLGFFVVVFLCVFFFFFFGGVDMFAVVLCL